MSARFEIAPSWRKALAGLLYGKSRELLAPKAWIQALALAAAVGFVLLLASWHAGYDHFWQSAVGLFLLNFAPLYCLVKAGDALRSELKDGGIEYLWTRPVGRVPLYLGFYASGFVSVAWALLVSAAAILAASAAAGAWPGWGGALALVWATALSACAYAAISLAFASWTSKYAVLGFLYFGLVEQGLGRIPTSVREVAVSRHARELAASLLDGGGDPVRATLGAVAIATAGVADGAAVFAASSYNVGGGKDA